MRWRRCKQPRRRRWKQTYQSLQIFLQILRIQGWKRHVSFMQKHESAAFLETKISNELWSQLANHVERRAVPMRASKLSRPDSVFRAWVLPATLGGHQWEEQEGLREGFVRESSQKQDWGRKLLEIPAISIKILRCNNSILIWKMQNFRTLQFRSRSHNPNPNRSQTRNRILALEEIILADPVQVLVYSRIPLTAVLISNASTRAFFTRKVARRVFISIQLQRFAIGQKAQSVKNAVKTVLTAFVMLQERQCTLVFSVCAFTSAHANK